MFRRLLNESRGNVNDRRQPRRVKIRNVENGRRQRGDANENEPGNVSAIKNAHLFLKSQTPKSKSQTIAPPRRMLAGANWDFAIGIWQFHVSASGASRNAAPEPKRSAPICLARAANRRRNVAGRRVWLRHAGRHKRNSAWIIACKGRRCSLCKRWFFSSRSSLSAAL